MAIELGRGARARTGHQLPALIRRLRKLDRLRDPRQELRAGAAPPRGLEANGETARPAGRSGTNPGTHRGASPPLQAALAPPPARPGAPARLGPGRANETKLWKAFSRLKASEVGASLRFLRLLWVEQSGRAARPAFPALPGSLRGSRAARCAPGAAWSARLPEAPLLRRHQDTWCTWCSSVCGGPALRASSKRRAGAPAQARAVELRSGVSPALALEGPGAPGHPPESGRLCEEAGTEL